MSFDDVLSDAFLYPTVKKEKPVKVFSKSEVSLALLDLQIALKTSHDGCRQVGSSLINGEGVDLDLVAKVKDIEYSKDLLVAAGYTLSSSGSGSGDEFCCFRKGDVNVMITESQTWFDNFVKSARACRVVTLQGFQLDKAARIAIHRVIMNGESPEEAIYTARKGATCL